MTVETPRTLPSESQVAERLIELLVEPTALATIRSAIVPADAWPEERRVWRQTAHRLAMDDRRFSYDEATGLVSRAN